MPPYLVTHDGSCGEFEDAETLTPAEIETLQRWASGPRLEGTRVDADRRPPSRDRGRAATTNADPGAGGPGRRLRRVRRVPLLHGGHQAGQGRLHHRLRRAPRATPTIVHHVAAFVVDPDQDDRAAARPTPSRSKALDDSDPDREGWPCFSLAGEGVEVDSVPVIWAPARGGRLSRTGLGVRQRADRRAGHPDPLQPGRPRAPGPQRLDHRARCATPTRVERRAGLHCSPIAFWRRLASGRPDSSRAGHAGGRIHLDPTGAQLGLPPAPRSTWSGSCPTCTRAASASR